MRESISRHKRIDQQTLEVDFDDELEVAVVLVVVTRRCVGTHDWDAINLGAQVDVLPGGETEDVVFGRKEELEPADVVRHVLHIQESTKCKCDSVN